MKQFLAMLLLVFGGFHALAAETNHAATPLVGGWDWMPEPPGKLVPVGDLPLGMAQSADGRWVVISHGGTSQQSLWLFDATTAKAFPIATARNDDAFFCGVAISPEGRRVFSSGGAANTINVHDLGSWWQEARLARFSFGPPGAPFFPAGLALTPDGKTLCVANLLADQLALLDVRNPAQPKLIKSIHVGSRPFAVLLDKAGQYAYVAHRGEPTVGIVDLQTKQLAASVKVGDQPMALALSPDEKLLYAACAGSDEVAVVDVVARKRLATIELGGAVGTQPCRPQALAISRDGKRLFVASALYHDLLVVDTARRKLVGMIPTGWCPTAVAVSPGNDRLYITSARDLTDTPVENVYAKRASRGLLQVLPMPDENELRLQSQRVCEACDYDQRIGRRVSPTAPPELPVPRRIGQSSLIRNVIIIAQERTSFDRVFGDLPRVAADPWLCYFGREITANQHALAANFTLCDNFYLDGPLLAGDAGLFFGGMGAGRRLARWPDEDAKKTKSSSKSSTGKSSSGGGYGGGYGSGKPRVEPADAGAAPLLWPTSTTLWELAGRAGLSRRAYGQFAQSATYWGASCTNWPGDISTGADIKRGDLFLHDLDKILKQGTLPRLVMLSLPNNQTVGTALGAGSPRALVCENDVAIGRIISAFSRSKFWKQTLILILPGDSGGGFDHLDAHRAPLLVVSPFARRGAAVSRCYDGPSVIRTIEQILGLAPAGLYDLAAVPMWDAFTAQANPRIHRIVPASYDTGEKNLPNAFGQSESKGLSLGQIAADRAAALNRLLWTYLHGPDVAAPTPVNHRRSVTLP
ncbi:MAG: bifunctional YncE family protein/alkaline phosphatase family protein [Verrucomicrobia bacterium]|nr:bifunctional YncE family protein/alkaline phosphatase family protein [Verrucomicrobiota bacterium]